MKKIIIGLFALSTVSIFACNCGKPVVSEETVEVAPEETTAEVGMYLACGDCDKK